MPRRAYRTRCFICRAVQIHTFARLYMRTRGWGSHQVLRLCRPCCRALCDVAVEVSREYR